VHNWTYRQALNEALHAELRADDETFIFGLDVDDHKSIFGSTENLLKNFGPNRVFGTPLSEDAMTGFAIGAAMNGKKPIHVHIRADFALLSANQIINMASNIFYLSGGKLNVPVTIRCVIGRGWGQGAQHSKSLHSLFAHFPGLKVFMPSSAQDAYSLTRAAIQDPNPVIILEHRWLYDVSGSVDTAKPAVLEPKIVAGGEHITIVSNSWMTIEALKAREVLNTLGIAAEVIDVGVVSPLNLTIITESVKKTGYCIVADHDWVDFGLVSELSARIHESCFKELKSPVGRIGFKKIPCPTARELENEFYTKAQNIIEKTCLMFGRPLPNLANYIFYTYEDRFKGPF
jgi:acetoin:2,6-dichlorophenolindophenol oxidoreductase subunit beta